MKKISVLAVALMLAAGVQAQEMYFRVGLGYGIAQAGQSMYDTPIPYYYYQTGYNGTRTFNNNGTESYNIKNASFSSGMQTALALGYMFNENVGVEMAASIGLSNTKYTFTDENIPLNFGATSVAYNVSTVQQAKTPFILMPSLVLQTSGDKLKLYSRFGLALPLNTKVTQDQIFSNAPGTGALTVDDFTWQVKSGFSLGFTAAAGVKYKISDKVSIWGELNLLSMSVNAKEESLKSWTEDGQSVPLSNYTTAQTIKLSKKAITDTVTYSQAPSYAQPFSNVGINVGVTFTISKHERKTKEKHRDEYIDRSKPFKRQN